MALCSHVLGVAVRVLSSRDVRGILCRQVAEVAVYSLHKSSTRAHLQKVAAKHPRCAQAAVLAELRFDLPAAYAFHRWAATLPYEQQAMLMSGGMARGPCRCLALHADP